jgi:hypothetical protein
MTQEGRAAIGGSSDHASEPAAQVGKAHIELYVFSRAEQERSADQPIEEIYM